MKYRIKHVALFLFLFVGVLSNIFAVGLVHDGSKISGEKSAVECERVRACEKEPKNANSVSVIKKRDADPTLREILGENLSKFVDDFIDIANTNGKHTLLLE
ncbi:MAG: hypothetical protein WAU01_17025, partial [Saprospiraceae bacterium]